MKVLLIKVLLVRDNNGSITKERSFGKIVKLTCWPLKDIEIDLGDGEWFIEDRIVMNIPKDRFELYQYIDISRHNPSSYYDKRCKELIKKGWKAEK